MKDTKPEFIIQNTEEFINGEKVSWTRKIQKMPHLIQITHAKTNFVEKPIRVMARIFNRFQKVKDKETGEMVKTKNIISKFVIFFCPETGLNYKHFNITEELQLFLSNPEDDNWVLRCKGEIRDEPVKQQQLDKNGKPTYVETGRRDYFFINTVEVRRDGKLIPPSKEVTKEA